MSPSTVRPLSVTTASTLPLPSNAASSSPPSTSTPWATSRSSNQRPTSSPKVRESATPSSITIVQAVPIAVSEAATSQPM